MINKGISENVKYGGTVNQADTHKEGMITFFKFNPAYRYTACNEWHYTCDAQTLLAFVHNSTAWVICDDQGDPLLGRRDYRNFQPLFKTADIIEFPVTK